MKWSFSNILPFLKFCIKPITLLIVLLFVGIVSFFKNSFENINTSEYILILSSLFLILVLIQFYMYRFVIKDRLYAVEKNGIVLFIIYHFTYFFSNSFYKDKDLPFIILILPITLIILYFVFYTKEVSKHRKFYLK